jgi:DNA invertase Pin-like site-specific DNA recombinase
MDIAFLNLTRAGPTEAEQRAACVAAGVDPATRDAWYVQPAPKRNRVAGGDELVLAIRALREGDRLVIHSAPRLGQTEAAIRAAAAAVSAAGAVIYDCAAGAEVRHHPDAGKLLAWAAEGAALAAKERLGKARTKISKRGAPPKVLTPATIKQAGEMRAAGNSWAKVAKALRVSVRTLYRHVPMKGDA